MLTFKQYLKEVKDGTWVVVHSKTKKPAHDIVKNAFGDKSVPIFGTRRDAYELADKLSDKTKQDHHVVHRNEVGL